MSNIKPFAIYYQSSSSTCEVSLDANANICVYVGLCCGYIILHPDLAQLASYNDRGGFTGALGVTAPSQVLFQ